MRTETAVGLVVLVAASIFFYMSFHIGAWRFDRSNYNSYSIFFDDSAGLSRKSDVKIAGVKVGFVDEISLDPATSRVQVKILIMRQYPLRDNARAFVRQEGMLGGKYLELFVGSLENAIITPGGTLSTSAQTALSLDHLMMQCKDLAQHVSEMTQQCKSMLEQAPVERLHQSVHNFNTVTEQIAKLVEALQSLLDQKRGDLIELVDTTKQAAQPLKEMLCKLNEGQGVLGKLIHDDQLYQDVRVSVGGVRNIVEQMEQLAVVYDTWCEPMQGLGNRMCIHDSKGYFNVRLFPSDDHFYLLGYVGVTSGKIKRYQSYREWFNDDCHPLIPGDMQLAPAQQLKYAFQKDRQIRQFDKGLWNVQYGKIYSNIALRFGIFDSTAGAAIDVNVPLHSDKFRWVTTLEAFDFRGRNRFGDDRPHLKWLNRLFFTPHIYATFGADDFVSRRTKNAFVGAGIRFADDDVKYLASSLSGWL